LKKKETSSKKKPPTTIEGSGHVAVLLRPFPSGKTLYENAYFPEEESLWEETSGKGAPLKRKGGRDPPEKKGSSFIIHKPHAWGKKDPSTTERGELARTD